VLRTNWITLADDVAAGEADSRDPENVAGAQAIAQPTSPDEISRLSLIRRGVTRAQGERRLIGSLPGGRRSTR
jgi:hypothetical protein